VTMLTSARQTTMEVLIVDPMLTASAPNMLYGGVRSGSRVCTGVFEGVSIVLCNETCRIDIWSIDDYWC
jgi:hypothetical protein